MAEKPIYARAKPASVQLSESYFFEKKLSRNPYIRPDQTPVGKIEIVVPYDGDQYFSRHAVSDIKKQLSQRGLRVIPIIVRHCTWSSIPVLKDLQALPKDGRPVISFKGAGQPDRIWTEIAKSIEELAKTL